MESTRKKRLERLLKLCKDFPEVDITGDQHLTFRVRKKIFAYYLNNHHGDGRVAICCRARAGVQADLIRKDPERNFVAAYLGPRGWAAARVDLKDVDWDALVVLLIDAYVLSAPKKLAQQITGK